MAVHGKPEPPRTLEEWRIWEDACIQTNSRDQLPQRLAAVWPRAQSYWAPPQDHPFQGHWFCWRCIAKAQGWQGRSFSHSKADNVICWYDPATRDETPEDTDTDPGTADPQRPALAGTQEHRQWWLAGASIVAEGNERPADFTDTGTFFYP